MSSKKYLNVLGDLEDESDDSTDDEKDEKKNIAIPGKKAKIDFETLENHGYKTGPSLLYVPEPKPEGTENWTWSNGQETKEKEPAKESIEEREQTRAAANEATEVMADYSTKAAAYAQKLREDKRAEQMKMSRDKRLTFQQKEKRKREVGQVKRGTNYVEEEKRVARGFGMYSGFDT